MLKGTRISAAISLHCIRVALSLFLSGPQPLPGRKLAWTNKVLLLHEPTVADHNGLPGQSVRPEGGQKNRSLSHIIHRSEFAIDGFLQHDIFDHFLLRDAEFFRLLRNLLLDQRSANKAGADYICTHTVLGALLGDNFCQTDEAMLGRDVRP